MNLVPKTVSNPIDSLRREVESVFDRWLPTWFRGEPEKETTPDVWNFSTPFRFGVPVDVEDTEDAILIRAEAPGLEKDQISIDVKTNAVVLRGEKKQSRETKEDNVYRSECSYGSFTRHIPLTAPVNPDKAEAVYKNGVLQIRLPKAEKSVRRRIEVKTN